MYSTFNPYVEEKQVSLLTDIKNLDTTENTLITTTNSKLSTLIDKGTTQISIGTTGLRYDYLNFPFGEGLNTLLGVSRLGFIRGSIYLYSDNISTVKSIIGMPSGSAVRLPTLATTAIPLRLSSSSASDTSAGIGARQVYIEGLNSSWTPVNETITLNGTAGTTTANSYLRVNKLTTVSVGSSGYNVGDLYLSDLSDTLTNGIPNTRIYRAMIKETNLDGFGIRSFRAGYTSYYHKYNVYSAPQSSRIITLDDYGQYSADGTISGQRINYLFLRQIIENSGSFDVNMGGSDYQYADEIFYGTASIGSDNVLTAFYELTEIPNSFITSYNS